jgi:hypothetical protein
VTAWRSLRPAVPTSASAMPSAAAMRRTASKVVRSRFSIVARTCGPLPDAV